MDSIEHALESAGLAIISTAELAALREDLRVAIDRASAEREKANEWLVQKHDAEKERHEAQEKLIAADRASEAMQRHRDSALHEVERLTKELEGVNHRHVDKVNDQCAAPIVAPIPMLIWCPDCRLRHIDEGEFATKNHHTHSCQNCGNTWRPAIAPTVGVRFLPGFKNEASK